MWRHPQPDRTRRLRSDEPSNTPLRTPCGEAGQDPGVLPTGSGQHGPQSMNGPAAGASFVPHSPHLLASIAGLAGCGGSVPAPYAHVARRAPVRGPGSAERGLRREASTLLHPRPLTSSRHVQGRHPPSLQVGRPSGDVTEPHARERKRRSRPGPGSPRPNHWRALPLKLLETSRLEIPKVTPSTTCRGDRGS